MSETARVPCVLNQASTTPIQFCMVYNPFDLSDRVRAELVHQPDKPLSHYLQGLPENVDFGVAVNAEPISQEDWDTTFLDGGDFLTVVPVPRGAGNGAKSILRLVALVIIAIYAPYAGGALASGLGLGSATLLGVSVGALMGAAIGISGALLVNTLLPATPPKAPDGTAQTDSPSYGIDGAKNTSQEGVPVPVLYGEYRTAGNISDIYTVNLNDTQILYMRTILSEGEIDSISDIEIDEQDPSNYNEVQFRMNYGTAVQAASDWFNQAINATNLNIKLSDSYTLYTTTDQVDQIRVDLVFPGGLFSIDKSNGNRKSASVQIDAQYRAVGATGWNALPATYTQPLTGTTTDLNCSGVTVTASQTLSGAAKQSYNFEVQYRQTGTGGWTTFGSDSGTLDGTYDRSSKSFQQTTITRDFSVSLPVGQYDIRASSPNTTLTEIEETVTGGVVTFTEQTQSAVRRSLESTTLPRGIYDVRVRRIAPEADDGLTQDQVYITDINEITNSPVRLNGTASLETRIQLTDQLSNVPNITALVRGVKVASFDVDGNVTGWGWSNNAGLVALDILTHATRGAGLDPKKRLDMSAWLDLVDYCTMFNLTFNGIFDYTTNIWDALQVVLRCAHAQIIPSGTRYSVAIERADTPRMMFGVGNIDKGSFQMEWLPLADRANEIEIAYFDKNDRNKQKSLRVVDPDADIFGDPVQTASYSMIGIDNADQAYTEAWYQLMLNKYIIRRATWSSPLEAVGCGIGDVVLIQHDMANWAQGGRLAAGSTSTVMNYDRPVTMEAGKNYKTLIHFSALKRYTGTVGVVTASSIFVSGGSLPESGLKTIRRAVFANGKDATVLKVVEGSPYHQLILDDASQISAGDQVDLWDTDVLEEAGVVNAPGEQTTVTLTEALSGAPDTFANFFFGEETLVKQPFRIISISGQALDSRQIVATEYNDSIYSSPSAPTPTPVSVPSATIGQVTGIDVAAEGMLLGTEPRVRLTLTWLPPTTGVYGGVDIFTSYAGGPWQALNSVSNVTSYQFEALVGQSISFKIVAFATSGSRAPFNTAPTFDYTASANEAPPAMPTNVTLVPAVMTLVLEWQMPASAVISADVRFRQVGASDWGLQQGVKNQQAVFTGLDPALVYEAQVRTLGSFGLYSDWTDVIQAQPLPVSADSIERPANPPAIPTGLALTSTLDTDENGVQTTYLDATWNANTESDLAFYEYSYREGTGSWYAFQTTATLVKISVKPNTEYSLRLRAFDTWGRASDYSDTVSTTSTSKTTPAALPTGLVATPSLRMNYVQWTTPSDADFSAVEVWASETDDNETAALLSVVAGLPTSASRFVHSGLNAGETWYYWLKSVNRSGIRSDFTAGVSATVGQVAPGDIAANTISAEMIVAGAIDASKIAAGTITADKLAAGAISAGSILISGDTTLADWASTSDETQIDGGHIQAGSIDASKVTISTRGIAFDAVQFSPNSGTNTLSWTAGTVRYIGDDGNYWTRAIAAGNVTWTSDVVYVYWIKDATTLSTSMAISDALADDRVLIAAYSGNSAFANYYGQTIIDGSTIQTGTITADRLKTGEVLTQVLYLGDGNIVLDGQNKRMTFNDGTRDRIVIGTLPGGGYGLTVYDATGNTILGAGGLGANTVGASQIVDASITSAKIVSLDAGKITATNLSAISAALGTVTTGRILSTDGKFDVNLDSKYIKITL